VWTHLALTRQGDTLTLYVNAQSVKTTSVSGATNSTGAVLAIGRAGGDSSGYFQGSLEEIAVYAHALTPERIRAHYNAAK